MVAFGLAGQSWGEADAVRATLLKRVAEKNGALIVTENATQGLPTLSCGCFVDQEGLAVTSLNNFTGKEMPHFVTMGGVKLGIPSIRHVDAARSLAFVKFDHRPEVWAQPREDQVPLKTELVAIVIPNQRPTALVGPVWARLECAGFTGTGLTVHTIASIAAGLPPAPKGYLWSGAPVLDFEGKLCGVMESTGQLGINLRLAASPSDLWFPNFLEAQKAEKAIPFPLPPELNPVDPAVNHPGYAEAINLHNAGQHAQAEARLKTALNVHSGSFLLKNLRFDITKHLRPEDLVAMANEMKPASGDNKVTEAFYFSRLGEAKMINDDIPGAALAFRESIRLAPVANPFPRQRYSALLANQQEYKEALRYAQEVVDGEPDNLEALYRLSELLGRNQRWEEEGKISELIYELENLYKPEVLR